MSSSGSQAQTGGPVRFEKLHRDRGPQVGAA